MDESRRWKVDWPLVVDRFLLPNNGMRRHSSTKINSTVHLRSMCEHYVRGIKLGHFILQLFFVIKWLEFVRETVRIESHLTIIIIIIYFFFINTKSILFLMNYTLKIFINWAFYQKIWVFWHYWIVTES